MRVKFDGEHKLHIITDTVFEGMALRLWLDKYQESLEEMILFNYASANNPVAENGTDN